MNEPTLNEVRDFRLKQLRSQFAQALNTLKEYEIPPVLHDDNPSIGRLETLYNNTHSLILLKIAMDEWEKMK